MALQNRRPARAVPAVAISNVLQPEYTLNRGMLVPFVQARSKQTGSPVGSINGDPTPAQTIVGSGTIKVTTVNGVTTVHG